MKWLTKNPSKVLLLVLMTVLVIAAALSFAAVGVRHAAPWLTLIAALVLPLIRRAERCAEFLTWKAEYATGLTVIDEEHKKLLTLINSLLAAVHCNTGEEFERHALNELVDYTKYHFRREEELMASNQFPDYEGHKAQHDQMIEQVEGFIRRYEERGREALQDVAEYLKLWLLQHILVTDRKYGPYLQERGVR